MKALLICLLSIISISCFAQRDVSIRVHKKDTIADNSLYYASTPADDAYRDKAFTYFRFLPGKQVVWFLNSLPPEEQYPTDMGTVAGAFPYEIHRDTLTFTRVFFDDVIHQTITDRFICLMSKNEMAATLIESIGEAGEGSRLYFKFKLFIPKTK